MNQEVFEDMKKIKKQRQQSVFFSLLQFVTVHIRPKVQSIFTLSFEEGEGDREGEQLVKQMNSVCQALGENCFETLEGCANTEVATEIKATLVNSASVLIWKL